MSTALNPNAVVNPAIATMNPAIPTTIDVFDGLQNSFIQEVPNQLFAIYFDINPAIGTQIRLEKFKQYLAKG